MFFYNSKKRNRIKYSEYYIKNTGQIQKYFFFIAFVIYICTNLYTYIFVGIPLFLESRQDLYQEAASGVGLLSRLSGFAGFYISIYSFYMIQSCKQKKYYLVFSVLIAVCLLSGSKGAIMSLVYAFFYYKCFYKGIIPKIKLKYLALIVLFPIITLLTYKGSSAETPLEAFIGLIFRFIANGDTYWCAYPFATIDQIHYEHPFQNLFIGLLGPFRLLSYENVEPSVGVSLFWEIEPQAAGMIAGPNARLAVLGFIYFGWFGLILSAIAGYVSSFMLYKSKKYFSHTILGVILYAYLYSSAMTVLTDPALFIGNISNMLFNLILYFSIFIILSKFKIIYSKCIR